MALFGESAALHAQQVTQPPSDGALPAQAQGAASAAGEQLQEVVITGIRAALEESLTVKKKSTDVIDVVTAEDIGKMPDKNIADSLSHVPGVTVSSAGANEGGFDENDRVSLRGTGPSLTQTLIDGHNVASGDWFVLNQTGTVGRSISYTLLPSELVSRVEVQKSSEANLVEGGVAGTVNIVTRKPLNDFNKEFTVQASAGAVYADLPSKSAPQFSALVNWRNPDSTFGVMAQGFYEDRYLRRDGTEILGYDQFGLCSQVVTGQATGNCTGPVTTTPHPDLANVWYPHLIGSAFFTQERKRTGGLLNVQLKPSDTMDLDLSGFYSKLEAPDYNRNYLMWATHFVNSGAGQAPNAGYTVTNSTLTSATFAPVCANPPSCSQGTFYGVYDQISRPDEAATSAFVNLDGHFKVNDHVRLDGQVGWSQGHGKTPTQNVSETLPGNGAGASWTLNGTSRPPDWALPGVNYSQPFPAGQPGNLIFGWIFGGQDIDTIDKETWAKLDATWDMSSSGAWQDLRFGARYSKHDRSSVGAIAQGPTFAGPPNGGGVDPANYPTTYSNYPSNYNTFGSNIPSGIWYWTPAQLAVYNGPGMVQRDPVKRAYPPYWFALSEPDESVYVQADFKGDAWSANFGVRYVKTTEDTITYIPMSCSASIPPSANPCPANTPNLVTGSLFGAFAGVPVGVSYDNVLPSWNFRYQFSPELIGHLAAAQTMTRPDYSALSTGTSLSPPANYPGTGSGSGSNPYLKPIVSSNFDATLEWYFAPRSLLSGSLFVMDLQNYIGFGSAIVNYPTTGPTTSGFPPNNAIVSVPYNLTVPINTTGRAQGIELTYQQSFGNFGVNVNYTFTDAKQTSGVQPNPDGTPGDSRLVGASKNVYNIGAYYETVHFSGRVSYNYRSAFYSGLDRSTAFSQDDTGDLNASFAYLFNDNLSLTLDGMNLNNPTLKYYALNTDQPRAFYKNGRQYYLTIRAKF